MAVRAGARSKGTLCFFGSIDCTEESLAQAFNRWKEHGAGFYVGKPRSVWAQGGLNAVIRGIRLEKERDPRPPVRPGESDLRFDKQLKKYFGEGVVVQGCAYGGRRTGKAYRFWMAAETLEVFLEMQILPDSDRSHCEACKAGMRHSQTACL